MKVDRLLFQISAAILLCSGLAQAQPHGAARSTSTPSLARIQLGDKVVLVPSPEGFEEASSQFKQVQDRFVSTEAPGADFLLAHLPTALCQSLRNGGPLALERYTKISVMQAIRERAMFDADMAATVAELRKNGSVIFDPDGPIMKAVTENAERGLSNLESKQIELNLNSTQNLGEFDVRQDVYSTMMLIRFTVDSEGVKSQAIMLTSLTLLKVKQRLLYVTVYRKLSSPAALKTELKPGVLELQQFTTKWVNEILAANKEG
jgi:hypothetical protein